MANIELDGANKKITVDSGDLTLDIPGDIILDADGGDIVFADGGTNLLKVTNSSSDVVFQPQVDTKDIVFKQYDGTVVATVEDNATFNVAANKLAINGTAITATAAELNIMDGVTATAAEINIIDGDTARGTTAIADGDGVLINDAGTMRMTNVTTLKTYIGGFDVSSITGATALAAEPAETDELVLSDAGTLKRLDFTHIYNLPACNVGGGTSIYPANNTATIVPWDEEAYDIGGCFNHTGSSTTLNSLTAPARSFTPNVPGVYAVNVNIYWAGEGIDGDGDRLNISCRFNGSDYNDMNLNIEKGNSGVDDCPASQQLYLELPFNGTGDYMQIYVHQNTGETPELNFGYSSMTIHRIAGLPTASRPDYG